MNKPLMWTDVEDVAILLAEARPDQNPLKVRFTDLHSWVLALPGFAGDSGKSNEKILEAIQMAWLEEYQENQK